MLNLAQRQRTAAVALTSTALKENLGSALPVCVREMLKENLGPNVLEWSKALLQQCLMHMLHQTMSTVTGRAQAQESLQAR